jgi:hypothetical protein
LFGKRNPFPIEAMMQWHLCFHVVPEEPVKPRPKLNACQPEPWLPGTGDSCQSKTEEEREDSSCFFFSGMWDWIELHCKIQTNPWRFCLSISLCSVLRKPVFWWKLSHWAFHTCVHPFHNTCTFLVILHSFISNFFSSICSKQTISARS